MKKSSDERSLFRTLQITVLYHRYFDGDIVSDHPQLFSVDIKTVVRFQNHQRARDVHPRCPTRHHQPRAPITGSNLLGRYLPQIFILYHVIAAELIWKTGV